MAEQIFLKEVAEDLMISKCLIKVKNESEAIALVENEWLQQMQSESEHSEWKKCSAPDDVSDYQITAELHHSNYIRDGYSKVFITCCKEPNQTMSVGHGKLFKKVSKSFGKLHHSLAMENFANQWIKSYATYKESYITEVFENDKERYKNYIVNGHKENSNEDTSTYPSFSHANCLRLFKKVEISGKTYLIKPCIMHSVYDALMYSPHMLTSSNAKPLFILYQLLEMMDYIGTCFPSVELTDLTWRHVELDKNLWIQADIHEQEDTRCNVPMCSGKTDVDKLSSNQHGNTISELTDKWVCGELSNFDYLMYLNKLAGRRLNDPLHHPILPWVSDLATEDGSIRDFTKSKYRLNKGDAQLHLQYAMAAGEHSAGGRQGCHVHVPHHVPDMLSDITFYVYKARQIPRDVLQKHVRSYWEPNEYPASIQRIQEWTPDECIPQFYTDPSIFKSMHPDMADLGIPDWCSSPEDFITKHMDLLESSYVSEHLHEWIDITFGYKLSGKHAVEAMNVCRQLVDQHKEQMTQGIVQLFRSPHPHRRMCSPHLSKLLSSLKLDSQLAAIIPKRSEVQVQTTADDESTKESTVDQIKSEEFIITDENVTAMHPKIKLPENYDPFAALTELEKLLNFKAIETDKLEVSDILDQRLQNDRNRATQCTLEEITSDRNLIVFICLTVELFLTPHANFDIGLPLSKRFETSFLSYESKKQLLPLSVKNALDYLLNCLVDTPKRTTQNLIKLESAIRDGKAVSQKRLFKESSSFGFPPPTPAQLLSRPMYIMNFPVYFENLYTLLEQIVMLTDNYQFPLDEEMFSTVREQLVTLLSKLNGNSDGMELLLPHIIQLLEKPFPQSVKFLALVFDDMSKELGPRDSKINLLSIVVHIFTNVTDSFNFAVYDSDEINSAMDILCGKAFLVQLMIRFGLDTFLENFPRLIIKTLIRKLNCVATAISSIQWLMSKLGPTLTSKYIVRHLLYVMNFCYTSGNDDSTITDCHVINCLIFAASLYGPSLFTLQYIPHVSFSVSSAISGTCFNDKSYAALEAATTLLIAIVPYLSDHILMEQLSRLSKEIIMPLIGILSSKRLRFPGSGEQRKKLCLKSIRLLVTIALRIGRDMARENLTQLLQSFFSNFAPKSNKLNDDESYYSDEYGSEYEDAVTIPSSLKPGEDSIAAAVKFAENNSNRVDGDTSWQESLQNVYENVESVSQNQNEPTSPSIDPETQQEINEELSCAFCPETAYHAYIPLTRLMGGYHMESILSKYYDEIWRLSSRYETALGEQKGEVGIKVPEAKESTKVMSIVGNRIIVDEKQDSTDNILASNGTERKDLNGNDDTHLKGNWLAYWEHEIGLASGDDHIHFNQIDLQSFQGHSASVRSMYASDSEEWFMSASKDKTVRIWSLQGGASEVNQSLFVYRGHKKALFYASLIEADNTVVSCDGSVHIWDPYTGQQICNFDSSDFKSNIVSMSTLPAPQRLVVAATSDTTLKMIDVRTPCLAQEYKTTIGPSVGVIRCVCAGSNWAALGFTSGVISLVDLRMGPILRMWQAHDNDLLTACAVTSSTFITSSLDQTMVYWDTSCITPTAIYRSIPEPVHCVKTFCNEIVSASNSNRIQVHPLPFKNYNGDATLSKNSLDKPTAYSKLRSDSLRGSLASLLILPMKRQLIVSSDSGAIKLMA